MDTAPTLRPSWPQLIATWVVFGACELAMALCWGGLVQGMRSSAAIAELFIAFSMLFVVPSILAIFQYRSTYQSDPRAASAITGCLSAFTVFAGWMVSNLLMSGLPVATRDRLLLVAAFLLLWFTAWMNWKWSDRLKREVAANPLPPWQLSLGTAFGLLTAFALQFAIAAVGLRFAPR
jgi:hypothetical protein